MSRAIRRSLNMLVGSLGLVAVCAVACGGDDDDTPPGAGGSASAGRGGSVTDAGEAGGAGVPGKGSGGSGARGGHTGSGADGGANDTGGENGAGAVNGTGGDGTSSTHDDLLRGLGFDTELGGPKGGSGKLLPTDYNPLRKGMTSFHPKAETYVAGIYWDEGPNTPQRRDVLFDDKAGDYASLAYPGPASDTWANARYKNGIAADLDGDGLDELLIVYYVDTMTAKRLDYVFIDPSDDRTSNGTLDANAIEPTTSVQSFEWQQPSLAKGDFDGSGRDQVAIGWFGLQIARLGDGDTISAVKRDLDTAGIQPDGEAVFVGAGDADGDKNDELAVTYSTGGQALGHVRVYDDEKVVRDEPLVYTDPNPDFGARTCHQAQVAIADVDGDHLGEIVLYGRCYGMNLGYRRQIFLMDDLVRAPDDNPWISFHHDADWDEWDVPQYFTTLDFNGDGVKDIFAVNRIVYVKHDGSFNALPDPELFDPQVGDISKRPTAGDVDGDGKDDLIVQGGGRIFAAGLNALGVVEDKQQGTGKWVHTSVNTVGNDNGWHTVILAAPNVDHDSALMRYDGERELLFTDPHVVAVVSSPPYFDGIDQDIDSTTSTFGTSKSMSSTSTSTVGFSVGFSVGYQTDFLFGEASFNVEIDQAFDFSAFTSRTFTSSLAYTTAPGQDLVVFTAIPFDVYYYTIVDSPTASEIGQKFTLNIPRKPQTIATDPAFFNARTGDGGLKIDERVLTHTLGDPWSYPTLADKMALEGMPGVAFGELAHVGQSGSSESTIQLDDEQGTGQSMDLSVTFSWSVEAKSGPTVGGSVGFNYGHSYEISTTDSTFFSGSVGAIPEVEFADHGYSWGLMAYPKTLGKERFPVLDYWVE